MALTGGIASGKSAVSCRFEKLGVDVVDTDVIAREVVTPGSPALADLVSAFGEEYLDVDGSLNRALMRETVFGDDEKRRRLEAILHPRIKDEAERLICATSSVYCIVVIPLFAETRGFLAVDRVLVVDAPAEIQVARLVFRDHCSAEQAKRLIASQASRAERLELADDVVVNDGVLEDLDGRVAGLHEKYLQLAEEKYSAQKPQLTNRNR